MLPSFAAGYMVHTLSVVDISALFVVSGLVALAIQLTRLNRKADQIGRWADSCHIMLDTGGRLHVVVTILLMLFLIGLPIVMTLFGAQNSVAADVSGLRAAFWYAIFIFFYGVIVSVLYFCAVTFPFCLLTAFLVSRFVIRDA